MPNAVIVDAIRTPVGKGKPGGAHSGTHPTRLLARTLAQLTQRRELDPALIDDVIGGCVSQVGEQSVNITRNAVLAAGFPESVPGTTIDRQCGSSQQAVHFAAQGIMAGAYDVVIACGVESMSRVPMGSSVLPGTDPFAQLAERYPDGLVGQGISAELIAAKWDLSRAELDAYAAESHRRAAAANFDAELAWAGRDESVRPGTTTEVLAQLKPAYYHETFARRFPEIEWRVTAGNASTINDGAAAVLLMSEEKARSLGYTPLARLHAFAVTGDDPLMMLTAVIPATEKVLAKAGLSMSDIDLFEVNEAFASVVLAWQRETGADLAKVNVNGGAIALGHPLGASGARLMTTLVHAMHARGARWGLQTMCEGGGMANATVIERLGG
ncbi:MAG: thiolase family protein [Streptosporangiaceae bacterium]|jgi:acetyl-CoA acyltransferase